MRTEAQQSKKNNGRRTYLWGWGVVQGGIFLGMIAFLLLYGLSAVSQRITSMNTRSVAVTVISLLLPSVVGGIFTTQKKNIWIGVAAGMWTGVGMFVANSLIVVLMTVIHLFPEMSVSGLNGYVHLLFRVGLVTWLALCVNLIQRLILGSLFGALGGIGSRVLLRVLPKVSE